MIEKAPTLRRGAFLWGSAIGMSHIIGNKECIMQKEMPRGCDISFYRLYRS